MQAVLNTSKMSPFVRLKTLVSSAYKNRPFMANCLTYGTLTAAAEFTQQTVTYKWLPKSRGEEQKPYDKLSILRYAFVGSCVLSPCLFQWYKWLDRTFVGVGFQTLGKKVFLDALFSCPYYIGFYTSLGLMEGRSKEEIHSELESKFVKTLLFGQVFWIPCQFVNFMFIPSHLRVSYIAALTFIEFTALSFFKSYDCKKIKQGEMLRPVP